MTLLRTYPVKLFYGLLLPLALLVLWQFKAAQPGEFGLPSVGSVMALILNMGQPSASADLPPLFFSLQVSLLRTLIGFAFAVLVGVPLGIFLGRVRMLRWLFSPLLNLLYVISPLAWLPLLIYLTGFESLAAVLFGEADAWQHTITDNILPAMLLIIFTASVFPILLTAERAASSVREDLLDTARLYGASRWHQFRYIILPSAFPEILSGIRLGLGRAWMVIIAAEMYPATRSGLGYTIWQSNSTMRFDYAVAAIVLIGLTGLVMTGCLYLLQKRLGQWQKVQA